MTANTTDTAPALDFTPASRALRRANAFVLANLASIIDVNDMSDGYDEDDYFVAIPSRRLHTVGDRICQLETAAFFRFDAGLSIMPKAVNDIETT